MPVEPAITDLEQLQSHPVLSRLLAWRADAVVGGKFDRNELTLWIQPGSIRDTCAFLRGDSQLRFNFLSDITCVDWYPSEPRFDVVYQLLAMPLPNSSTPRGPLQRLRLKVRLPGEDPVVESVISVWPGADLFEREVFDLFGVRFQGHPYMRRLMMPEEWEGHPLRKDYPVEGYR